MLLFLPIFSCKTQNLLQKEITISSAQLACTGKNTEYHKLFQRCVCKKGFPYGNPEKSDCYNCDNVTCHSDAICSAMNTCTCRPGKIGDGINNCEFPRPRVIKVDPLTCATDEDSYITFSFKSPAGYNSTKPDCLFGSRIVTPMDYNGTHGVCKCPPSYEGNYSFALTFDHLHWSKENITITFQATSYKAESILATVELIFVTCVIIFFVGWFISKVVSKNGDDGDQILPLNKWHMSQLTHEQGEESNFFKFLLGLIIG